MIITVGGSIGSGKSTLAKDLAKKLSYKYFSVGRIMRELADELGMSLMQLSKLAEEDPSIDRELDSRQIELAKNVSDCIFDSRLGAHLIDSDFRIWLEASLPIQSQRISLRDNISLSRAEEHVRRREASEAKRYKEIYGIDTHDLNIYDLVLDTSNMSKDEMLDAALNALKKREDTANI